MKLVLTSEEVVEIVKAYAESQGFEIEGSLSVQYETEGDYDSQETVGFEIVCPLKRKEVKKLEQT